MSGTDMEQFTTTAIEQDHAEALQIDALVDPYTVAGVVASNVLSQAIEQNNQTLIKPYVHIPQAEEMGYDMLKNAFRWWNYATAYLRDLEADLEPGEALPISRANYGETKNETGDRLIGGDFLTFRICDLLEKERRSRGQRKDKEHSYEDFDLFRSQNYYASLALATTVEMLVIGSDGHDGFYEQVISNSNRTVDYKLQLLDAMTQTLYIVHKQVLETDEEYDGTKYELQGTHSFTRPHNSLMVYPDRPEEIIATDMLAMVDDLSTGLDVDQIVAPIETALEAGRVLS